MPGGARIRDVAGDLLLGVRKAGMCYMQPLPVSAVHRLLYALLSCCVCTTSDAPHREMSQETASIVRAGLHGFQAHSFLVDSAQAL